MNAIRFYKRYSLSKINIERIMLMKLDELIRSVIDGEVVELGRYEVLVSKALREITGGVEIYDIQVEETAPGERDVFKTFEAFANEDCNIANNFKCNSCGEYIDRPDGFYVDNEMFGTFYDSFGCLVEAFNAFQSPDLSDIKKKIYIYAERYLSRKACSMTINVSKGEMNKALEYKLDAPEKFTLIYNGITEIDLPDKEELNEKIGLKKNVKYVGFTGRCAKQKDPMTFLEIAKQVISRRDDTEFIYIGDGELQEQMQDWIINNNLTDKIHMLGFRNDSAEIVGVFDVYLSTALYEGLPYSMIEAMRAGVPIIATDCIGNNELVFEGINGHLFPIGDIESGVKCLLFQIENEVIIAENVRDTFSKTFSLNCMLDGAKRLYAR